MWGVCVDAEVQYRPQDKTRLRMWSTPDHPHPFPILECDISDGSAYFKARFRLVVFRPFVGEVLVGKLKACTREVGGERGVRGTMSPKYAAAAEIANNLNQLLKELTNSTNCCRDSVSR